MLQMRVGAIGVIEIAANVVDAVEGHDFSTCTSHGMHPSGNMGFGS